MSKAAVQCHLNKHFLGCWKIDLNKTCNNRFTTEAGRMKINKLCSCKAKWPIVWYNVPGRRKPLFIQELDSFNLKLCTINKKEERLGEKSNFQQTPITVCSWPKYISPKKQAITFYPDKLIVTLSICQ